MRHYIDQVAKEVRARTFAVLITDYVFAFFFFNGPGAPRVLPFSPPRRSPDLAPASPVKKPRVPWRAPRPAYDVPLVAIASGPPVTGPYWPIPKPYQPNSRVWEPRVLGATNPKIGRAHV